MRICSVLIGSLLLAACQQTSTVKEEAKDQPVRQYPLHGEVLRLDPQGKIAAIKHQKIGDWMEAMTMEFPVRDQPEFDKLHVGEKIDGTVFVQGNDYWVGGIHESPAADAAPAPASK